MFLYMTRVELHGASPQDYANLHQYMINAGFRVTITGQDGVTYHLPTAEYLYTSMTDYTAEQVREMATIAASRTGRSNGVITSRATNISWLGLKPV